MNKEKQKRPEEEPVAGVETAAVGEDEAVPEEPGGLSTPGRTMETRSRSWEEILEDPEYKSRYDAAVQGIVKARLKSRAQAEEKLARLAPVLEALEESYGLTEESDLTAVVPVCGRARGCAAPAGSRSPSTCAPSPPRRKPCRRACRTSTCCGSWRTRRFCA